MFSPIFSYLSAPLFLIVTQALAIELSLPFTLLISSSTYLFLPSDSNCCKYSTSLSYIVFKASLWDIVGFSFSRSWVFWPTTDIAPSATSAISLESCSETPLSLKNLDVNSLKLFLVSKAFIKPDKVLFKKLLEAGFIDNTSKTFGDLEIDEASLFIKEFKYLLLAIILSLSFSKLIIVVFFSLSVKDLLLLVCFILYSISFNATLL